MRAALEAQPEQLFAHPPPILSAVEVRDRESVGSFVRYCGRRYGVVIANRCRNWRMAGAAISSAG